MTTHAISVSESQSTSERGHENKAEPRAKSSAGTPPHGAGMLWFGGWLFTIGFAKLVWWKALIGFVVWPYFLGESIR